MRGCYISEKQKNLIVFDKENVGYKSDALNVGLNFCQTPFFVTVDADVLIEPEAITNAMFTLLSHSHTISVGCGLYIITGSEFKDGVVTKPKLTHHLVPALQACEFLRSFFFGRSGWNAFGGALCFPGAFTLFERQMVLNVSGFQEENVAEDMEIILRLHAYCIEHKYPCKLIYDCTAAAWLEQPLTLKAFWRQRWKWQQGILLTLLQYKRMFFNPKYGIVGIFSYPFNLLTEGFGAVVEVGAYLNILLAYALGILDWKWAVLFFVLCWGFISFLTMANVLISIVTVNKYKRLRDVLWFFALAAIETFGFRQYHQVCRACFLINYFFFKKKKTRKDKE